MSFFVHIKDCALLYIALSVLGFCSYITAFSVIPFTEITYQLTLTDSLLFLSMYIVIQMTLLLYVEKASTIKLDIGISVFSFISINFFFSYIGIGNIYDLYIFFNYNTDFIADPQKFAAFSINIALLVDLVFINIFNLIYFNRIDAFTETGVQNEQKRIKKEKEAKKIEAQKKAKEIEKQQKKLADDLIVAKSNS